MFYFIHWNGLLFLEIPSSSCSDLVYSLCLLIAPSKHNSLYMYLLAFQNVTFTSLFKLRQKALKELNERLNKIEETTSWPSLEDTPSDVAAVSNTSNTQASERPPQKEDFVSITVNETSNNNEEQTV